MTSTPTNYGIYLLDPNARLDYDEDWAADHWLRDDETILEATATASSGIEVDGDPEISEGVVKVWVKNGTAGTTQTVTVHIVTSQGREDDRTLTFRVKNR